MDIGYNVTGGSSKDPTYKRKLDLQGDGSFKSSHGMHRHSTGSSNEPSSNNNSALDMNSAYDSVSPGMDDNAMARLSSRSKAAQFDWKKRATTICEQVKLRGLDPLDFGCIAKDSLMSPAYSWRGHAKMICGRLGTTMDPDLPVVCGCPPQKWKGWSSPS